MLLHRINPENAAVYSTAGREYAKVDSETRIELHSMVQTLHLHSWCAFNLATLKITRLYVRNRLHRTPSRELDAYFTPFFEHFDTWLAAQIFATLSTGTIISREAVSSILECPIADTDDRIVEFSRQFSGNYRSRTCDLPSWFEHEDEASVVPQMLNVQFRTVVKDIVFAVAYDIRWPRRRHDGSRCTQYVTVRDGRMRWLDLEDDYGVAGHVNQIVIQ